MSIHTHNDAVNLSWGSEIHSFAKKYRVAHICTLGIGLLGYIIGSGIKRLCSWIKEPHGTTGIVDTTGRGTLDAPTTGPIIRLVGADDNDTDVPPLTPVVTTGADDIDWNGQSTFISPKKQRAISNWLNANPAKNISREKFSTELLACKNTAEMKQYIKDSPVENHFKYKLCLKLQNLKLIKSQDAQNYLRQALTDFINPTLFANAIDPRYPLTIEEVINDVMACKTGQERSDHIAGLALQSGFKYRLCKELESLGLMTEAERQSNNPQNRNQAPATATRTVTAQALNTNAVNNAAIAAAPVVYPQAPAPVIAAPPALAPRPVVAAPAPVPFTPYVPAGGVLVPNWRITPVVPTSHATFGVVANANAQRLQGLQEAQGALNDLYLKNKNGGNFSRNIAKVCGNKLALLKRAIAWFDAKVGHSDYSAGGLGETLEKDYAVSTNAQGQFLLPNYFFGQNFTSVSSGRVSATPGYYTYQDVPGKVVFNGDFANAHLAGGFIGRGNVQEEDMFQRFIEMIGIAASKLMLMGDKVTSAILTRKNQQNGTDDSCKGPLQGSPTPFLAMGVHLLLETPPSAYGRGIGKMSADAYVNGSTFKDPKKANIIALAAADLGNQSTNETQWHPNTLFDNCNTLLAAAQLMVIGAGNDPSKVVFNSGKLGCGAFGQNAKAMYFMHKLVANQTGIEIVMHDYSAEEVAAYEAEWNGMLPHFQGQTLFNCILKIKDIVNANNLARQNKPMELYVANLFHKWLVSTSSNDQYAHHYQHIPQSILADLMSKPNKIAREAYIDGLGCNPEGKHYIKIQLGKLGV